MVGAVPSVARRVEPHDRNQLELKLAYLVDRAARRHHYMVEAFLFFPSILGVSKATYSPTQFYGDIAAFLRLQTPHVALAALAASAKPGDRFEFLAPEHLKDDEPCSRQLKVLGCIYRAAFRDRREAMLAHLGSAPSPDLEREVATYSDHHRAALARLREAEGPILERFPRTHLAAMWHAVDEYVSLEAESAVTALIGALEARPDAAEHAATRALLVGLALHEYERRKARGYGSVVKLGEPNEAMPYRRRILKRILFSALYLDVRHENPGSFTRDLIGMLAAGAAMLFAVLVAAWAQARWGTFSVAFFAVAVLSYAVKDRIKEKVRDAVGRRLARWIPDTDLRVFDADGRVVGRCRESFRMLRPDQVDRDVVALRYAQRASTAGEGRPEWVAHYVKHIDVDGARVLAEVAGTEGVNDIIRYNFSRLRARMDNPVEEYTLVHPRTHKLVTLPCARVYHVNVVLRLTTTRGDARYVETSHVRVVLDQSGIQRVERVAGRGEVAHDGADL